MIISNDSNVDVEHLHQYNIWSFLGGPNFGDRHFALPPVQAYPRPSLVELEAVIDLMCSGNLTCQLGWHWETWKFMEGRMFSHHCDDVYYPDFIDKIFTF